MELTVRVEQGIQEEEDRDQGQGQTCGILKWIKGAKVGTRNRNVTETKQGHLQQE